MSDFTLFDALAFGTFCLAWFLYHHFVEHPRAGEQSLNGLMDRYRARWIKQMEQRAERIFDTQVLAGLQNGTAFSHPHRSSLSVVLLRSFARPMMF